MFSNVVVKSVIKMHGTTIKKKVCTTLGSLVESALDGIMV